MTIASAARLRLLEDFGLKAAEEGSLEDLVARFQADQGLDDRAMREALSNDAPLRRKLAARLSVGESFFLRGAEQLEHVVRHVEQLLSQRRRPVLWSAGCARGEEPYSVAIALAERWGSAVRDAVELLGTDLDADALRLARRGVYSSWSFRGVSQAVVHKYFRPCEGGYRLVDELLGWPRLQPMSIQEHLSTLGPGSVDIVLFRNVGIYLTDAGVDSIHAGLSRVLSRDGLLVQAVTDPAPSPRYFTRQCDGPHGLYVHPALAAQPKAERPARSPRRLASGTERVRSQRGTLTGQRAHAARATRSPAPEQPESASALKLRAARELADAGRLGEAVEVVSAVLRSNPREPEGYVLRGQLHLHEGKHEAALDDLRAALFLEPGDVLVRYWYSVALDRSGWHERAAEQRRVIEGELGGCGAEQVLADGATTVRELRSLVESRQEASS